jgi:glycine betaine/choline ABC-type transport system substrate-binding protein
MPHHSPRTKLFAVLALSTVLAVGLSQAATKSTLVFDGKSKSKGEIVFGVTPQGGETQEITITAVEKMGASEVASAVLKEFQFALSESFKISGGGTKVNIKPVEKGATFEIKIVNQTVQGISVTIK